ncbi:CHASE3 domain sensor protein [Bradyrhizobium sp. USDA 4454]
MPVPVTSPTPRSRPPMASRFSLAARLYSTFALIAALTAAITFLSDTNARRNAELTEAVDLASRAALNVERVNSLVYAVVMESRGIYMSTDPAAVKKYGDGLLAFSDRILSVVKNWETLVQADDAAQFAAFKARIEQFVEFRKELVRRGIEIGAAAGREWGDNDANRDVRTALNKDLEALSKVYAERSKRLARQTDANRALALLLTGLGAAALIVVVLGVLIIARSVARPSVADHRDHQARRRRRRPCRSAPCRARRRDRRPGARHQGVPGGDGAQSQSECASPAGFRGP